MMMMMMMMMWELELQQQADLLQGDGLRLLLLPWLLGPVGPGRTGQRDDAGEPWLQRGTQREEVPTMPRESLELKDSLAQLQA